MTKGDAVLNANNTELPIDQDCTNQTIFSDILNHRQIRLCQHNRDNKLLSTIAIGVLRALHQCQKLFKDRPWNCTVFDSGPYFGRFVERGKPSYLITLVQLASCSFGLFLGTRETAFLNAIISAGIAREVARKCKEQSLEWCTCDFSLPSDWRQTYGATLGARATIVPACGDNDNYGIELAKQFTDAGLRVNSCTGRAALHNNKVGRKV